MYLCIDKVFWISTSRAWARRMDYGISIGFGWREEAEPGEIAARLMIKAAWDWLPTRIFFREPSQAHCDQGEYASAEWTGRFLTFQGFARPISQHWRRSFWFYRYRKPSPARPILTPFENSGIAVPDVPQFVPTVPATRESTP